MSALGRNQMIHGERRPQPVPAPSRNPLVVAIRLGLITVLIAGVAVGLAMGGLALLGAAMVGVGR